MNTLHLALRNLNRYKTRTLVTVLAVFVSVLISIVVDGFLRGVFNLSTYNLLSYESSEATIYSDGYFEKRNEYPSENLIEKSERDAISSLLDNSGYLYAPRYKTGATLLFYNESEDIEIELNAILVGLDLEKDGSVYSLSKFVRGGEWLTDKKEGIVLGEKVAEKLGVKTGDSITVELSGRDGFKEVLDEEIVGIVNTENPAVNSSEVFMSLDVLDDYLYLDGAVSEIDVSDGSSLVAKRNFVRQLNKILPSKTKAYYYEDVNSDLMAIMTGDMGGCYFVLIFLFVIAAIGISNTIIMALMERQKETAMMLTLGFSHKDISFDFVLEGLLSGLIGAVIGLLIGLFILIPLSKSGIDISSLVGSDMDYGYRVPLLIRPGVYFESFIIIPLLALFFSVLSAYLPLRHFKKKEISTLFRGI